MKADKLFYAYEWIQGLLLSLRVTSGAPRLCQVAVRMTQDLGRQYAPRSLKLILDAGGCSLKALKGLLRLAHTHGVIFYLKAVKTPPLKTLWYQAIEQFGTQEVVHPHDLNRPPDEQRKLQVTDVFTSLPGLGPELRTLLIYRPQEEDEDRRLMAIYTNDLACTPAQGYAYFGQRQHHELTYRVLTHDLNLDVLPKTYALHPKDPKHPNRKTQRAFLIAWIKALAFNLLRAWQQHALPEAFRQTTVGTLVRKFLRRNATLQVTDEGILVTLEYFRDQHYLGDYVRSLNAQQVQIPWLDHRVLKIQLTSPTGIPFFPQ